MASTFFRMRSTTLARHLAQTCGLVPRRAATSPLILPSSSASPLSALCHHRQMHSSARLQQQKPAGLDSAMRDKIHDLVHSAPVVVFMKGTQEQPMCGFSRNVKLVLDLHHIPFKEYNVLEDEQLRQGIKEYSEWPTIPQVYVNGKFIGGCDILVQMHKDKEIYKVFDEEGIPSQFSEKFPPPKGEAKEE